VRSDFPVRSESLPSLLDAMKQANLTESVSFGLATGASYSKLFHLVALYNHNLTLWCRIESR